jgi:hypothetical protein
VSDVGVALQVAPWAIEADGGKAQSTAERMPRMRDDLMV